MARLDRLSHSALSVTVPAEFSIHIQACIYCRGVEKLNWSTLTEIIHYLVAATCALVSSDLTSTIFFTLPASVVASPGDVIVSAGETGNEMFFIDRGRCEVITDSGVRVNTLVSSCLS